MFNSYRAGDVTNTLKINACSGGIYKTYKESWFKRFHLTSRLADELFNSCSIQKVRTGEFYKSEWGYAKYDDPKTENKEVIILQMIICGDMEVIAELITKEDFDKYFENKDLLKKEGK